MASLIGQATLNGLVLKLHQGSALNIQADVLVNAANENLAHGGGIAGEIAQRAGQQLIEESKRWIEENGPIISGGVASTSAGNLQQQFRFIVHAVGPKDKDSFENKDMLVSTLVNSFKETVRLGCSSISVPGLSCGIFGFPKEVSAKCHFEAFVIFASQIQHYPNMREVNFALFTAEEVRIFADEFLDQSDKFDEFNYFGTLEEQGLNIFMSYCTACQKAGRLELFTVSMNCCKKICNFCFSARPGEMCYACRTPIPTQVMNMIWCQQCHCAINPGEQHVCRV